jgi:hypothetical protein
MPVMLGTNSGFVKIAPTADPVGGDATLNARAVVTSYHNSGAAVRIIEMGWYTGVATEEANFEIGLYAADGIIVPGEAGTLLFSSTVNAKGTTIGWKRVTGLDWAISPNTYYWFGLQLDDTVSTSAVDRSLLGGGRGLDILTSQTALPNPFGGEDISNPGQIYAVYAVYQTTGFSFISNKLRPAIFKGGIAR